jgi:hypothetical protein
VWKFRKPNAPEDVVEIRVLRLFFNSCFLGDKLNKNDKFLLRKLFSLPFKKFALFT